MKYKEQIIFFIKMTLIVLLFDCCTRYLPAFFTQTIITFKYGKEFIAESIFALLILIMVITFKNSYIFTEKKEPLSRSIYLGLPMLILGSISLLSSIFSISNFSGSLINLLLFSIAIGIAEEFMCRGWIQNEFIEKFSKNYKEVFVSILLSSFIFGAMHITNIFQGQTIFETVMQIIQATSLGFLLGSIYFRSKNIWAVVFLHTFYDFSFMFPEVNSLKDCTGNNLMSLQAQIGSIYASVILSTIFFISGLIVLRKSKVMHLINPKDKTKYKDNKNLYLAIIFTSVLLLFVPVGSYEDIKTCYTYDEELKTDYETIYPHYTVYNVNLNNNEFSLYLDNKDLIFKNNQTGEHVILFSDFVNYYNQYELVQDNNGFKILIFINGNDSKVYYKKYTENDIIKLDSVKSDLKEFILPDLKQIGLIQFNGNENKNVFMISKLNNKFYINDLDELKLIKDFR